MGWPTSLPHSQQKDHRVWWYGAHNTGAWRKMGELFQSAYWQWSKSLQKGSTAKASKRWAYVCGSLSDDEPPKKSKKVVGTAPAPQTLGDGEIRDDTLSVASSDDDLDELDIISLQHSQLLPLTQKMNTHLCTLHSFIENGLWILRPQKWLKSQKRLNQDLPSLQD